MKIPANTVQASIASPLGRLLLAASADRLVGVWFDNQAHLPDLTPCASAPDHPVLTQAAAELAQYFAGQRQTFDVPLDTTTGTSFQQAVWQALQGIPVGTTCSYGELARRIGQPAAVRAVGAAVGRNPLGIIVPCHRVVGSNGSLTGYAGGLPRKTALLQLEGAL
ncbi:methylated-DNA--[protein]-cysteine S-methyltransferase [Rhodoferax sp. U2-2l]|uniref:methylated-DNA--[protein]-cysteine S-methyltransferase n=1 Tax=Rhodoferax sp. U2-2l TaxID=2884000 RepID=UPI001D0A2737|nr:methylated-DNA--[protein]-cysteine S-methyltransferase [Rhodoferax sp. U2-2l]MCB8747447.1 methylated-DNA--[protein]-cysteine S-methyltransferase [Rhodoferax sp. U2-2l]